MGIGIFLIRFFSGKGAIDEWGSITMVLAYSSILMLITQFGQGTNMLKRMDVSLSHVRLVQFNSFILSVVPVIIGWIFKDWLSKELALSLMLAPFFIWYRNFSNYFQRQENSKVLFSVLNQDSYIYYILILVVVGLYSSSVSIEYYFSFAIGVLMIAPVVYYVLNMNKTIKEFSLQSSKENLIVSFPFFVASGSAVLLSWTDTIMLGNFKGDEVVGIYNGIFKISSLVTITLSLLNSFVAPRIRTAYEEGVDVLKELVKPYNRMGFGLSLFSYLIIVFLGPFIFNLMNLPYSDSLYQSLLVLAFGYVINASVGNVGFLLQLTGNHRVFNKIVFVALILNIVLNIVLIPRYGIMGAAIASTVTMSLWNMLSYIMVKVKLGFSPI